MPTPTYNYDAGTNPNRTLKQLRDDMMTRLGFAAQVASPPPGMSALLNSFLVEAQELLYRRYSVLRTDRAYSWPLTTGVRFYDLKANAETSTLRVDPRKIRWVGVVRDGIWRPMRAGIPPELYSNTVTGWPTHYEIRDAIEVWPAPLTTDGSLVVKGDFGPQPFAADTDQATIDDRPVFLLALSNAKAHYGRPDAGNYVREMETLIQNLVAGTHGPARYIPGRDNRFESAYVQPVPTVPFV
jgi:hypothetical protein